MSEDYYRIQYERDIRMGGYGPGELEARMPWLVEKSGVRPSLPPTPPEEGPYPFPHSSIHGHALSACTDRCSCSRSGSEFIELIRKSQLLTDDEKVTLPPSYDALVGSLSLVGLICAPIVAILVWRSGGGFEAGLYAGIAVFGSAMVPIAVGLWLEGKQRLVVDQLRGIHNERYKPLRAEWDATVGQKWKEYEAQKQAWPEIERLEGIQRRKAEKRILDSLPEGRATFMRGVDNHAGLCDRCGTRAETWIGWYLGPWVPKTVFLCQPCHDATALSIPASEVNAAP